MKTLLDCGIDDGTFRTMRMVQRAAADTAPARTLVDHLRSTGVGRSSGILSRETGALASLSTAAKYRSPLLDLSPSLLDALRDSQSAAKLAEAATPAFEAVERQPMTPVPLDYSALKPAWADDLAALREQAEAGEERATQVIEFLATITGALSTANERAELAEDRAEAAENSQREALHIARSSRRWTILIGVVAIAVSVLIAVLGG